MSTARKDILDAAIREFARAGFDGASTVAIARESGTKQPLLYYHFGSKQKLWQAAVDFGFVELKLIVDTLDERAIEMEPVNHIKLALRTLNRFACRQPRHIDILRQELNTGSQRADYLLDRYLVPMYTQLKSMIEAATAAGQIRPIPPQFLSSLLFGAVTHYVTARPAIDAVYGLDVNDTYACREHGEWLVEVLFEGLSTQRK